MPLHRIPKGVEEREGSRENLWNKQRFNCLPLLGEKLAIHYPAKKFYRQDIDSTGLQLQWLLNPRVEDQQYFVDIFINCY